MAFNSRDKTFHSNYEPLSVEEDEDVNEMDENNENLTDKNENEECEEEEEIPEASEGENEKEDEILSENPRPEQLNGLDKSGGLEINVEMISIASRESIPKSIHQIARDGDVKLLNNLPSHVEKSIKKSINSLDKKLCSPLHYATRYSHYEMMEFLVKWGADVNKPGDDDMTPLHFAARYSKKASRMKDMSVQSEAKVLVVASPDSTSGNESESNLSPARCRFAYDSDVTPNSSRRGSDVPDFGAKVDRMIKFLVANGADVNAKDTYKLTALHHASIRGNVAAINSLMEIEGIVKEPRDVQDSTPLHIASTYDHFPVVQALLSNDADPRKIDCEQRTPLHEACLEGNASVAELLLQIGEQKFGEKYVKSMMLDEDSEGCTPLLLGVGSGREQVVKILLGRGANVNTTNHAGIYPVHSAARTGDLRTLKLLVKNKARLDVTNALLQTPLFLAAQNNHRDMIKFLIQHGASVNIWDIDNLTPLSVAAREGHDECVGMLIKMNANLEIVDRDEKSCLYLAAEYNRPKVVRTILSHKRGEELLVVNDQYDNLPIHVASVNGNYECLKLLLEYGTDIDNKNEDEQTPLHLAAIHGKVKVAELILGRDRNAVMGEDEDSNTALHLACEYKQHKVVELLLASGADVQSRNAKKWTPLDCAAFAGAYKCAKLLLENDAPIDPVDRSRTTPLHLAAQNGHEKMILLLLENGANISSEDVHKRNMLELAILSRKKQVVKTVLQHKDWKKAMRTTYTVADKHGTPVPETPMRLLIRIYPDLAELVFDQCMTLVKTEADQMMMPKSTLIWQVGAKVEMNYEFIDDSFSMEKVENGPDQIAFTYNPTGNSKKFDQPYDSNGKVVMDNHPLMIMAMQKQKNLLRHPLCLALVRHKWRKFGRYIYYGQLSLYCLFLFFLTTYVLIAPNPAMSNLNCANENATLSREFDETPEKSVWEWVCQVGIMVLVAINLTLELVQFYRARSRYFQWTNLFDWAVYVLALILVYDIEEGSANTGIRACWQWELGAIVIVLAWLNLLGDIRQLPFLGIYVIMFFDILKTFMKFVLVFLVFIIAFGLGFHLLLLTREGSAFEGLGYSLLKTTVMMIGEFEFDSLFFADDGQSLPFEVSTVILFVVFLVVMAIIIMNLLVGLAVDDIKAVQEQAVLQRLAMQVDQVLDVERSLPTFILKHYDQQLETIQRKSRSWWSVFTDVVSSRNIVKDATNYNRHVVDLSDVMDRQDLMDDSMKSIRSDVKILVSENEKIRELLFALVEKSQLEISNEDVD